jgi:solute carrier family 25 S-adenosylmethionine transporter 26
MPASQNRNTDILLAGAFAAFTVDLLVYPLDTIKTRIQSPNYKKLYTTDSGQISRTLFRGLYQGIGSVVLATIPSSGAFFTTYEGTKALLHSLNPLLSNSSPMIPAPFIHAAASSTAELVSCLILTPAEVLKQNAQVVQKSASSSTTAFDANATIQAFKKFNRPSQLLRGYTALVARNLPFTAMQFPMFEKLKNALLDRRKKQGKFSGTLLEKGTVTSIAAGSAGSLAAIITTPIDVVKTRIMLSASSDDGREKVVREDLKRQGRDPERELEQAKRAAKGGRAGCWAVGREILRTEGVKGLFRGGALRGLWTAFGSGLYLGVYESGRTYLERRRD